MSLFLHAIFYSFDLQWLYKHFINQEKKIPICARVLGNNTLVDFDIR